MKILVTPYAVQHESMMATENNITAASNERPTTLLIIDADHCKTGSTGDRSTYV